jgi:hypothetical protein
VGTKERWGGCSPTALLLLTQSKNIVGVAKHVREPFQYFKGVCYSGNDKQCDNQNVIQINAGNFHRVPFHIGF